MDKKKEKKDNFYYIIFIGMLLIIGLVLLMGTVNWGPPSVERITFDLPEDNFGGQAYVSGSEGDDSWFMSCEDDLFCTFIDDVERCMGLNEYFLLMHGVPAPCD